MLLEYKGWSKPVLGTARVWRQGRVVATSAQPAPDPHRTHLHLARDLLAVSLHPWRWFSHPPCFVSPGLGCWLCCFPGTPPSAGSELVSGGLSLPGLLGCPCQSCSSPSGVLPVSRSLLFPFLSTSCFPQNPSPRRLWRSPFPPGGGRQLRVHGSKWSH